MMECPSCRENQKSPETATNLIYLPPKRLPTLLCLQDCGRLTAAHPSLSLLSLWPQRTRQADPCGCIHLLMPISPQTRCPGFPHAGRRPSLLPALERNTIPFEVFWYGWAPSFPPVPVFCTPKLNRRCIDRQHMQDRFQSLRFCHFYLWTLFFLLFFL